MISIMTHGGISQHTVVRSIWEAFLRGEQLFVNTPEGRFHMNVRDPRGIWC